MKTLTRLGAVLAIIGATLATPDAAVATEEDERRVQLGWVSTGANTLEPGDAHVVVVKIANTALDPLPGISATSAITSEPLTSSAAIDQWLAGTTDPTMRDLANRSLAGDVPPLSDIDVTLVARPDTLALPENVMQVYGVEARVENGGAPLRTVRSVVVWNDAEPRTLPVAVVVTAAGTPTRVETLIGVGNEPDVTMLVDLSVVEPEVAATLAERDLYRLPASHADIASIAHAGNASLLDLALERSAVGDLGGAPWVAVVPDLDEDIVSLTSDREVAAIVVSPSYDASVRDLPLSSGSVFQAEADGPIVVLPAEGLSHALGVGPAGSPTGPARVVAELALLAEAVPEGESAVAMTESGWAIESDYVSARLEALLNTSWVTPITLSEALESSSQPPIAFPAEATQPGDVDPRAITDAGSAIRLAWAIASVVDDPGALADPPTMALLDALGFHRRSDPDKRDEDVEAALESLGSLRGSLNVPEGSALNLISRSGEVPITVTNELPVAATVTVVVESRSPNLRIQDAPEVTIPAESSQQVLVPVTGVSSANVSARVTLVNADGQSLGPPTEVRIRIRADWGETFTLVVAVVFAALLITGIIRTIRRGRTGTRVAAETSAGMDLKP